MQTPRSGHTTLPLQEPRQSGRTSRPTRQQQQQAARQRRLVTLAASGVVAALVVLVAARLLMHGSATLAASPVPGRSP